MLKQNNHSEFQYIVKFLLSFKELGITFILGIFLSIPPINAQDNDDLELSDAIGIGLENNYSILLARNSEEVSNNNATIGNAGMLPSLTLNGTLTKGVADTRQEFIDGRIQDKTGAKSTNLNGNLAMNWTLFDGLTMFAQYNRLKELEAMGEENVRATIQHTVSSIMNTYFDIVSQQQELEATKRILQISRQRLKSANDMFQSGKVSKVDYLSAQVDYNSDTASFIQQTERLRDSKILLNKILAREIRTDFYASDTIHIDPSLMFGEILDKTLAENPDIVLSRIAVNAASFSLKAVQGSRYPQVRFTSTYTMTKNTSESGQVMENKTNNFSYGLTASMPLFNGFEVNRQIQNARLEREAATLRYAEMQKEIEAQAATAYSVYEVNKKLVDFENANLKLALENLDIAIERYKLGAISAVELREVQRSYISATNRLIVATYNAKVAETALKLLTGEVMQLD